MLNKHLKYLTENYTLVHNKYLEYLTENYTLVHWPTRYSMTHFNLCIVFRCILNKLSKLLKYNYECCIWK